MDHTPMPALGSKRRARQYTQMAEQLGEALGESLAAVTGRRGDDGECPCDCSRRHPAAAVCAEITDGPDGAESTPPADGQVCSPCVRAARAATVSAWARRITWWALGAVFGAVVVCAIWQTASMLTAAASWVVYAHSGGADQATALAFAQACALTGLGWCALLACTVWAARTMAPGLDAARKLWRLRQRR